MGRREGDTESGHDELSSKPAFYMRSASPLNLGTALLLLGSLLGILTFVGNYSDKIEQNLRIELRNEETKRLNSEGRLSQRIDDCCRGRR